jgi:nicotinate-nucleotide adenylyltransferase
MRIGVFGGTFDPPHLGHLILAEEAGWQLRLDRLLWVLTPDPPHKLGRPITTPEVRLAMLQAATCDNPGFELSQVELNRPGPHYAVDTVRLLADANPGAEIVYLMGGDSLRDLPTWYHPGEFINRCASLGVMRRPGDEIDLEALDRRLPGLLTRVEFINAPLLEISASQIRHRAAVGQPFRYFIPPAVYEIIIAHGLYQNLRH